MGLRAGLLSVGGGVAMGLPVQALSARAMVCCLRWSCRWRQFGGNQSANKFRHVRDSL
jgi:hypothetical protein